MIVIAGTIGAGKSTLTELLAEKLDTTPFYESVDDNEVLPLFYSNPVKYAFLLQIFFLNKRFLAYKKAFSDNRNVLDRSIYEDSMLFHLNADLGRVNSVEVEQYDRLLETMLIELEEVAPEKTPDLLVYIDVSFETMLERIQKRGREYEQIDQDPALYAYYKELHTRYTQWYEKFDVCPKIVIDGNKHDFVADHLAAEKVIQHIRKEAALLEENTTNTKSSYATDIPEAKGIFQK